MTPQQQKLTNTILAYWEFATKDIERYQCTFQLWRYDPVFGPADPETPIEFSEGVIKYEAPDRGLYKVDKTRQFRRPQEANGKPTWPALPHPGDHWVCDGTRLYEFDHKNKVLIKRELPPNVRGVHIANGPLPFLLKAKASQVRDRFWVRVLPSSPGRKHEYKVEAYPKRRADAANFQKLHIVLNDKYIPTALILFSPGFRPDKPTRTTYNFNNIEVNPNAPWFGREFIVTKAPGFGWKEVEEPIPGEGPTSPPANASKAQGAPDQAAARARNGFGPQAPRPTGAGASTSRGGGRVGGAQVGARPPRQPSRYR